jgi:hypothetical protein
MSPYNRSINFPFVIQGMPHVLLKRTGVLEYCSHKVQDFIESCSHFVRPNWQQLQTDILKYYDAERLETRYRPQDLINYLKGSLATLFYNLGHWKKYYRNYTAKAGHLLSKGQISDVDYKGYFWFEIPTNLRDIFEEKLYARYPNHNTDDPWPIDYITTIADAHFRCNKFTQKLTHLPALGIDVDHGYSDDSDTDMESEDSDNDSDDSDYETYRRCKRRTSKKKKSKTTKTHQQKSSPVTKQRKEECLHKINVPPEEVDGIIQQLNTMSLDDPRYGQLYFKAVHMDETGLAEKCIRRQPKQELPTLGSPTTFGRIRRPEQPHVNNSLPQFTRPNNILIIARNSENAVRGDSPMTLNKCYGCFEPSHMLGECPKMADMIRKGLIKLDPQMRKYCLPDGNQIYRLFDESIVDAVQCLKTQKPSGVHYVTLADEVSTFYRENQNIENEEYLSETEDEDDGPYWKYGLATAAQQYQPSYYEQDEGKEKEENMDMYAVERTAK